MTTVFSWPELLLSEFPEHTWYNSYVRQKSWINTDSIRKILRAMRFKHELYVMEIIRCKIYLREFKYGYRTNWYDAKLLFLRLWKYIINKTTCNYWAWCKLINENKNLNPSQHSLHRNLLKNPSFLLYFCTEWQYWISIFCTFMLMLKSHCS